MHWHHIVVTAIAFIGGSEVRGCIDREKWLAAMAVLITSAMIVALLSVAWDLP